MSSAKIYPKYIALVLITGLWLCSAASAQTADGGFSGGGGGGTYNGEGDGGDTTSTSTASNNYGDDTGTEAPPDDASAAFFCSIFGIECAGNNGGGHPTASATPPTVLACTLAHNNPIPLAPYDLTPTPSTMTLLTSNECESTLDNCYSVSSSDCGPSYAYVAPGGVTPSPFVRARTTPGQGQAIDVWNICRYIDDISASRDSYFVPFRTSGEWWDFIRATGQKPMSNNAYLALCSRYASFTFPLHGDETKTYGELSTLGDGGTSVYGPTTSDPQAVSPQQLCWSGNHTTTLPYARVGTLYEQKFDLSCNPFCFTNSTTHDTQCGSPWTNPVTITYTGGNSNTTDTPPTAADNGGWTETPSYVPPPEPAYPSCDPRLSTTPSSSGCSSSCGGVITHYATDNCGVRAITGYTECSPPCPPPPRSGATSSGGGCGSSGGSGVCGGQNPADGGDGGDGGGD